MSDYLTSLGQNIGAGIQSGATAGASGLITGLVGAGIGALTARKQYKRQKTLMRMQHAFEQENMALQDKYQRSMMRDSNSLMKQSLQNAGYSTADPNGTGTTAPHMSMPGTSASGMAPSNYIDVGDGGQTFSAIKAGQLSDSQRRLNEIEEQYRARLLEGEIGERNAHIKQITETLPEQINLLKAQVVQAQTQGKLNEKQAQQVDAAIDRISEETKSIQIDNKYKDERLSRENQKLAQEVALLIKNNRIKEAEARLADYGILVGLDGWSNLLSVTLSGNAGDVLQDIMSGILSPLEKLPDALSGFFRGLLDAFKGLLPKWLRN